MGVISIAALQWENYTGSPENLLAVIPADFAGGANEYSVVPRGQFGTRGDIPAAGVVCDNLMGFNSITLQVGAVKEVIPPFQKGYFRFDGAPVTITFRGKDRCDLVFYSGKYPGAAYNYNQYASQQAANMDSVTSGTLDAYFKSLKLKGNIALSAAYDLNTLEDAGFFDVSNPTNGPGNGIYHIVSLVFSGGSSFRAQLAYSVFGGENFSYYRQFSNGNWTTWRRIWDGGADMITAKTFSATQGNNALPNGFDLNNLLDGAVYDVTSPTNGPGAGSWYIEHRRYSDGSGYLQTAINKDRTLNTLYYRRRSNAIWGPWNRYVVEAGGVVDAAALRVNGGATSGEIGFGAANAKLTWDGTTFGVSTGELVEPGTASTVYAPTLTASAGVFTVASAKGRHKRRGKMCFVELDATITTNGTASGGVIFSLPFTPADNTFEQFLTGRERGLTGKMLVGNIFPNNPAAVAYYSDGTYPGGNGALVRLSGWYETT